MLKKMVILAAGFWKNQEGVSNLPTDGWMQPARDNWRHQIEQIYRHVRVIDKYAGHNEIKVFQLFRQLVLAEWNNFFLGRSFQRKMNCKGVLFSSAYGTPCRAVSIDRWIFEAAL